MREVAGELVGGAGVVGVEFGDEGGELCFLARFRRPFRGVGLVAGDEV
jgi:hypothetical protein